MNVRPGPVAIMCMYCTTSHAENGISLMGQLHQNHLEILGTGSLKVFGPGEVLSFPHQLMARTVAHHLLK